MTDAPNPSADKTEPVAWLSTDEFGDQSATVNMDTMLDWRRYGRTITPLYTHPQPSLSAGLDRERLIKAMRENIVIGDIGSCSVSLDGFEEAADAILAFAAPAGGYVLVPVEPTHSMHYDGDRALVNGMAHGHSIMETTLKVWSAMIAACLPAAPTGETGA